MLRLAVFLAALLLFSPLSSAQPMMPDPAQMSGIPRPDSAVPSGSVTVRLIRGAFTSPIVDQEVTLTSSSGTKLTARSDAAGRATFSGVPTGTYQASCVIAGNTKTSQPIAVMGAPAPGMRVMLVFPKDTEVAAPAPSGAAPSPAATAQPAAPGVATGVPAAAPAATAPAATAPPTPAPPADGQIHAEAALPVGTLRIFVVDEANKPLAGIPVTLYRRSGPDGQVEKLPAQTTSEAGAVLWAGMATGPAEYLVTISRFGYEQPSEPFHLEATTGTAVSVMSRPPARGDDARRKLTISTGSHIIFDLQEDMVAVSEMLRLNNPSPQAFDPGAEGLRISLPEGAIAPALAQGSPSTVSVDQSSPGNVALVWKGPLSPGESMLQVNFMMRHTGELQFRQPASLAIQDLRVVIEKRPALTLDGVTDVQERNWQGHQLLFGAVSGTSEGGQIQFTISGLPAEHRATRLVGGVLAILILAAFVYLAWQGKPGDENAEQVARKNLSLRRDKLLGELLALEETPPKGARSREQVMRELTGVYRALDEADAS